MAELVDAPHSKCGDFGLASSSLAPPIFYCVRVSGFFQDERESLISLLSSNVGFVLLFVVAKSPVKLPYLEIGSCISG